ncbi:MAG: cysteine--tRNA ligase, partial [Candidatus Methanoplasma sp.]|nr:cysteine--tRNA ligase [Candidatus Methanoplasma sp.]
MSLTIHNNLTNKKEEFVPIEPGKVSMYVCGVTVYDDIHMGHARSMIVFDTVARYLRYLGYEVTHVTNFTDVDDKIINRANERGIEPLELSAEYIRKYFEDASHLGINKADLYPKASESIDDIIEMVQAIIKNGYGYTTPDGSVYFEVGKVKNYGRLSNQKLEDMQSSGRVVLDDQKKNPMDFAVWKTAKPGECTWNSPWGHGRPGWHIECSAMIRRHLGDKIDIHGGGNDLIFPHHENEILQTEAVTGDVLANYWMHNGMLQVKDQKMSKSLGNFFKVEDVAKKFDSQTIRFYFLNTHYSSPLIYGEEAIIESQTALKRLWNNYRDLREYAKNGPSSGSDITDLLDE